MWCDVPGVSVLRLAALCCAVQCGVLCCADGVGLPSVRLSPGGVRVKGEGRAISKSW